MESDASAQRNVFRLDHAGLQAILASVGDVSTPQRVAALLGRLHDGGDGSQFVVNSTLALAALEMGGTVGEGFARMMADSGLAHESQLSGFKRTLGDTRGLFAAIFRWALEALSEEGAGSFPKSVDPWVPGGGSRRVVYTPAQCRGLLANALLMNVEDTTAHIKTHHGGLRFADMIAGSDPVAAQKFACLLNFFEMSRALEGTDDDLREVVVELRSAENDSADIQGFQKWALEQGEDSAWCCESIRIELHEDGMEGIDGTESFVNFANAEFGYGCFIPSCTQEEIMQICCPEFNVGMLHLGRMTDNEVVVVHGVRRYSSYSGYGSSFEYVGPWTGQPNIQSIITIDASTSNHFREDVVLRDIRKAYLAFNGCTCISTGRWGCGAFGGTPAHKLAQQVVAASLARCSLQFSTFGNVDHCDEVLAAVGDLKPTLHILLKAVLVASSAVLARNGKEFHENFALLLSEMMRSKSGQSPGDLGTASDV